MTYKPDTADEGLNGVAALQGKKQKRNKYAGKNYRQKDLRGMQRKEIAVVISSELYNGVISRIFPVIPFLRKVTASDSSVTP